MTPKAKKALEGSIRKWERILIGSGEDHGDTNCPLCKVFNKDNGCRGCPVRNATGKDWCDGTPYIRWLNLTDNNIQVGQSNTRPIDESQRAQALKMLRFLEGLR